MSEFEKQGIIIGISGGGSTMRAVYAATQDGRLPKTQVVGVFASNPSAGGIEIAKTFKGLDPLSDVVVIDSAQPDYGQRVVDFFQGRRDGFRLYCQYGLTPHTPNLVIDWLENNGKIGINQHGGAVNPDEYDFGGKGMGCPERFHAARLMFVRATDYRDPWQMVVSQTLGRSYDEGVVFRRGMVPILEADSVTDLKQRAIGTEWDVQIQTLRDFEDGKVEHQPPIPDLVRVEERPLLQLVKGIAVKLYTIEGELRSNPDFESLIPPDKPEVRDQVDYLVGLLKPSKS